MSSTASKQRLARDSVINVRVSVPTRDLIDNAAAVEGKTRTEFVVESARQHAIDVLLDHRLFSLSEDSYASFVDALDHPPAQLKELRELLRRKAPWEK